jgi:spermidine synthase
MRVSVPRSLFFLIFTVSGFAGLIYESIWSHYIKLFLGHAAYAQTLVLSIFMGGMALGAWLCGRFAGRWRNLLLAYAGAEAVIGVLALVFHPAFTSLTGFAYASIMPALGGPAAITAFKWSFAALFILPQSILLGMTFPLMTAGVLRLYPQGSGSTIAMLYFTNSLGAAIGVLASGFVLIGLVGLPGTMLTAGLVNLFLALVVWGIVKALPAAGTPGAAAMPAPGKARVPGYALMLWISLLTGCASFMYEIGWIRMLSMVLGSSTHAFELMLSAFILGLAFGGLWVKRRIDALDKPERTLGLVQVAMGVLALGTLLVYGQTFYLMQTLLDTLARTEQGYAAFNIGSHLIALAVMFPPAFCAGMTLPLITQTLIRRGAGERAIGAVYAANTVGAIAGVMGAVHLGMPLLGLKGLISLGAAIDIALGLVLLWWIADRSRLARFSYAAGIVALAGTLAFVQLDSYKMASGVYRHGRLFTQADAEVLFHRDGKTATINLLRLPDGKVVITTNGKSDAGILLDRDGPIAIDESTMILTGALPIALHPRARTAANIGFGSGVSSHVMLASGNLRELDTIEIEPAIVEAGRGFRPRNDNVFDDPRSRIHVEDAKTFFSAHNKRYDIIVSEPSNPWVSGVASLFTEEFYGRVQRHLAPDGLFVQWLQLYEISPQLVASVFKSLGRHFSHYQVYSPNDLDMIIVARNGSPVPPPSQDVFSQPGFARELARIHVRSAADMELHRLGSKAALQPYFESFRIPANSDYFPILDLRAARARFMGETARDITRLGVTAIPALEMLGTPPARTDTTEASRIWLAKSELKRVALAVRAYLLEGRPETLAELPRALRTDVEVLRWHGIDCRPGPGRLSVEGMGAIADAMIPHLPAEALRPVWRKLQQAPCAARRDDTERQWIALYAAVSERNAREMARLGEALLGPPGGRAGRRGDYLLGAAVVGRLAGGDAAGATALWHEHSTRVVSERTNMLGDLLLGHVGARR